MELIAIISYIVMGVLLCVALFFGNIAERQIKSDNSCDEISYKKFKKYLGLMMGTFVFMFIAVIFLAIYVIMFR